MFLYPISRHGCPKSRVGLAGRIQWTTAGMICIHPGFSPRYEIKSCPDPRIKTTVRKRKGRRRNKAVNWTRVLVKMQWIWTHRRRCAPPRFSNSANKPHEAEMMGELQPTSTASIHQYDREDQQRGHLVTQLQQGCPSFTYIIHTYINNATRIQLRNGNQMSYVWTPSAQLRCEAAEIFTTTPGFF